MTKKDYQNKLNNHDWFYVMSDDPKVYEAGLKEEKELKNLFINKGYEDMYKAKSFQIFNPKKNNRPTYNPWKDVDLKKGILTDALIKNAYDVSAGNYCKNTIVNNVFHIKRLNKTKSFTFSK